MVTLANSEHPDEMQHNAAQLFCMNSFLNLSSVVSVKIYCYFHWMI